MTVVGQEKQEEKNDEVEREAKAAQRQMAMCISSIY